MTGELAEMKSLTEFGISTRQLANIEESELQQLSTVKIIHLFHSSGQTFGDLDVKGTAKFFRHMVPNLQKIVLYGVNEDAKETFFYPLAAELGESITIEF